MSPVFISLETIISVHSHPNNENERKKVGFFYLEFIKYLPEGCWKFRLTTAELWLLQEAK